MKEEQKVKFVLAAARDVVDSAEVTNAFEDTYVVHVPREDWEAMIVAIDLDVREDSDDIREH